MALRNAPKGTGLIEREQQDEREYKNHVKELSATARLQAQRYILCKVKRHEECSKTYMHKESKRDSIKRMFY